MEDGDDKNQPGQLRRHTLPSIVQDAITRDEVTGGGAAGCDVTRPKGTAELVRGEEGEEEKEDKREETPAEREKRERREELLQPESLQRLLADALTYQSPLKDLETIVTCGADVNGTVKRGLRPLHYAVHSGYVQGIRFLLRKGADVNAPDDIGYRPVHLCARKGLLEPLQVLIANRARIDFFSTDDDNSDSARSLGYLTIEPLNMAIENNHINCARLLLQHGARADHQYFLGHEINLVPSENLDCLKMLLEFGADPNVFSRCGLSPLMKASRQHNIRAVRLLVEHGAQLNLQPPTRFEQKTAIHFAIQSGSKGIIAMLVRHGAMVTRPSSYRYSALQTAVVADSPDLCEVLIRWDARVDELSDENSTALQLACATPGLKNRQSMVEILLRSGADPNVNSPFVSYSSPFLAPLTEYMRCVTDEAQFEVVRLLLAYGAKVHFRAASTSSRVRDAHGILHCAQYLKDKTRVFNLLMSAATVFEHDSIRAYTSLSEPQREVLLFACGKPRDLRTLTHLRIRDLLNPGYMLRVSRLPVPNMVKDFLLFLAPPALIADG